ncbi:MAG: ABC transporter ATP-binding protein [Deltaproteobacteria bacterium]|nr:ABC transporter ATP-binding protein [Deltaproteobacteria bacterium]
MSLLKVENLRTHFKTEGGIVKAVDGVNLDIQKGEIIGIVGESGSGKSVTCLSVMKLIPQPPGFYPSGKILFNGQDLMQASSRQMEKIRGNDISMIFQDPMSSLNPFLTVETQLTEVVELHQNKTHKQACSMAIDILGRVGISNAETRIKQYPHQFSGGQRQRIMIAMALLCKPELLIADEPTTALDVTIQAQILDLMKDLNRDFGTSIIMITHDLGVVAGMSDRVLVMYAGKLVEKASGHELFEDPQHPYTKALLHGIPRLDTPKRDKLDPIPGLPPNLANLPGGCSFHPRCAVAMDRCSQDYPDVVELNNNRAAACWKVQS